jgi:hypothetical protein
MLSLILLAAVFAAQGCSDRKPEEPAEKISPAAAAAPQPKLTIKDWGPRETKAGKGFNMQPNGASAFWFNTENATSTTVVVVNENVLPTVVVNDGEMVTAGVPASIFATAGEFPVYLLDQKTKEKSNEMKFSVK